MIINIFINLIIKLLIKFSLLDIFNVNFWCCMGYHAIDSSSHSENKYFTEQNKENNNHSLSTNKNKHSVSNIKKDEKLEKVRKKLAEKKYVPPGILKELGLDNEIYSAKWRLLNAMQKGESCFAKAKPAKLEHLAGIRLPEKKQPYPKKSLTRMLTGDVPPQFLVGLGRMQADKVTPFEGYKDVFVSSLEEYEKKGIFFDPHSENNAKEMAKKLDLLDTDVKKIEQSGAWLIQIHPGSKLAIPTERKNEWNPGFIEGGYTGSDQQEWVTPNLGLDSEVRAGNIRIYKMDSNGKTQEWKFFQEKLMPLDEWKKTIESHVAKVSNRALSNEER